MGSKDIESFEFKVQSLKLLTIFLGGKGQNINIKKGGF
jgi:hypothetical protein